MEKKKLSPWNFFDRLEGDKVVWIIAIMLILLSIVCIFSSTSKLLDPGQTRLDIVRSQLFIVAAGICLILVCYSIRRIGFFRWCSKWGFLFSFLMLFILDTGGFGPFKAQTINGATRTLRVFGFQLHVFEVAKIAMVMYLSWAVEICAGKDNSFLERFAENNHIDFVLKRMKLMKKLFYMYIPFVTVTIMIMPGSNSSALFIGGIMFLTIVIGGANFKDALYLMGLGGAALGLVFLIYFSTGGALFGRLGTLFGRLDKSVDYVEMVKTEPRGSAKYQMALDKIRQPYSAKIAIHQGGLFGKGPGQSTQRYAVPDISEDFMFSFIVEEYGLFGGILVMMLYVSLMARGSIIARNCGKDIFCKTAVAGLTLLITGQAFMHIIVNADFGILTGQTLPLISHGNSAFLCFCIAFGLILTISRTAQKRIEREQEKLNPLMEVKDSLDDLESLESGETPESIEEYDEL